MKTISKISKELGISVQEVHKRIKRMLANPDYKKELPAFIQKDMKVKMYLDKKREFTLKSMHQPDSTTTSTNTLNSETDLNKQFKLNENIDNTINYNDENLEYSQLNDYFDKLVSTTNLNHNNCFSKYKVEEIDYSINDGEKSVDKKTNCVSYNQHNSRILTGLSNMVYIIEDKQFF
jgi:hypothetical protein